MNGIVELILEQSHKVSVVDIGVLFTIIFGYKTIWLLLEKPSPSLFKLNHDKSLKILASTFLTYKCPTFA